MKRTDAFYRLQPLTCRKTTLNTIHVSTQTKHLDAQMIFVSCVIHGRQRCLFDSFCSCKRCEKYYILMDLQYNSKYLLRNNVFAVIKSEIKMARISLGSNVCICATCFALVKQFVTSKHSTGVSLLFGLMTTNYVNFFQ